MLFKELAKKRCSVRNYKDMPVEKEIIIDVLESARIAPSAVNFQPWHFIVLTDKNMIERICESYSRDWLKKAPVIIVACGDHSKSWKRKDGKDHCDVDIAIAVEHITLAASDIGLGTCWVCAFDADKCSKLLELPDEVEPVALIPMGYPADENPQEKKRKSIEEVVSWEGYKR